MGATSHFGAWGRLADAIAPWGPLGRRASSPCVLAKAHLIIFALRSKITPDRRFVARTPTTVTGQAYDPKPGNPPGERSEVRQAYETPFARVIFLAPPNQSLRATNGS